MQALIDAAVKARGNSVGAQMAKLENVPTLFIRKNI